MFVEFVLLIMTTKSFTDDQFPKNYLFPEKVSFLPASFNRTVGIQCAWLGASVHQLRLGKSDLFRILSGNWYKK